MSHPGISVLLFGAMLAIAVPARAQSTDTTRPPDTSTTTTDTKSTHTSRLHASHRVDIIAPGEKIETIIDRMRANRATAPQLAPGTASNQRPNVRGPEKGSAGGGPPNGPPDGHNGGGGGGPQGGGGPDRDRPHR